MSLGVKRGMVVLSKYSEEWREAYLMERDYLIDVFQNKCLDVQHIGSTSVPGLIVKPLIDIAIKVVRLDDLKEEFTSLLEQSYTERVGRLAGGQKVFAKYSGEKVTHHLHVIECDELDWELKIRFRNIMLSNPNLVMKYAALKLELLEKFKGKRLEYTEGKAQFIRDVLSSVN